MKLEEPLNRGYAALIHYIKLVEGLGERMSDIKEIYPDDFSCGGIKFSYTVNGKFARFKALLNFDDVFDLEVRSNKDKETFLDLPARDFVSILFSLLKSSEREEEELLRSGVKLKDYNEVAKLMIKRDETNGQGFQKE